MARWLDGASRVGRLELKGMLRTAVANTDLG